jgi:hypothetical protein
MFQFAGGHCRSSRSTFLRELQPLLIARFTRFLLLPVFFEVSARPQCLFVSYLAPDLLCDLWRHRLHPVFLSGVLRRFLHQLIFVFGSGDIIAAVHQVTATKHFGH